MTRLQHHADQINKAAKILNAIEILKYRIELNANAKAERAGRVTQNQALDIANANNIRRASANIADLEQQYGRILSDLICDVAPAFADDVNEAL